MGLVKAGIDHTTEAVEQDKARQVELSGLRACNVEYDRRKANRYNWLHTSCAALTFFALVVPIALVQGNWVERGLVGIGVATFVGIILSGLAWWVEDRLIKRDMRKEGWPVPPQ